MEWEESSDEREREREKKKGGQTESPSDRSTPNSHAFSLTLAWNESHRMKKHMTIAIALTMVKKRFSRSIAVDRLHKNGRRNASQEEKEHAHPHTLQVEGNSWARHGSNMSRSACA
jgi:hypothetical protein